MNAKPFELASGKGNLPVLKIHTPWSDAEIYLHGAHVTHFQKNGEPPLLFMSHQSWFAEGKAIRGGVPICFPWFGPREGEPAHGLVRTQPWELVETVVAPDGSVKVHLRWPQKLWKPEWSALHTEFIVTVTDTLTMELIAANESKDKAIEIENCLHNYFNVGDISAVSITGLQGGSYLDTSGEGKGARKAQDEAVLKINKETNRIYLNSTAPVEIRDEKFRRTIRVEKANSQSTVVWNPWTTQKLPEDFDPVEHKNMVCVETANVKENKISLGPGKATALKTTLGSAPLK